MRFAGGPPPSLAPRAAEAIDPRVPVVRPMNDRPVDAALARRLAELVSQARSGDSAFRGQAATAERLAAAAGPRQSESWIAAQEALSAAIEARAPTATALGDIDALGADKLQAQGGLAPADLAAIRSAGDRGWSYRSAASRDHRRDPAAAGKLAADQPRGVERVIGQHSARSGALEAEQGLENQ